MAEAKPESLMLINNDYQKHSFHLGLKNASFVSSILDISGERKGGDEK